MQVHFIISPKFYIAKVSMLCKLSHGYLLNLYRYKDFASDADWKELDVAENAGSFFYSQPQKGHAPQSLQPNTERMKLKDFLSGIKALNRSGKVSCLTFY